MGGMRVAVATALSLPLAEVHVKSLSSVYLPASTGTRRLALEVFVPLSLEVDGMEADALVAIATGETAATLEALLLDELSGAGYPSDGLGVVLEGAVVAPAALPPSVEDGGSSTLVGWLSLLAGCAAGCAVGIILGCLFIAQRRGRWMAWARGTPASASLSKSSVAQDPKRALRRSARALVAVADGQQGADAGHTEIAQSYADEGCGPGLKSAGQAWPEVDPSAKETEQSRVFRFAEDAGRWGDAEDPERCDGTDGAHAEIVQGEADPVVGQRQATIPGSVPRTMRMPLAVLDLARAKAQSTNGGRRSAAAAGDRADLLVAGCRSTAEVHLGTGGCESWAEMQLKDSASSLGEHIVCAGESPDLGSQTRTRSTGTRFAGQDGGKETVGDGHGSPPFREESWQSWQSDVHEPAAAPAAMDCVSCGSTTGTAVGGSAAGRAPSTVQSVRGLPVAAAAPCAGGAFSLEVRKSARRGVACSDLRVIAAAAEADGTAVPEVEAPAPHVGADLVLRAAAAAPKTEDTTVPEVRVYALRTGLRPLRGAGPSEARERAHTTH